MYICMQWLSDRKHFHDHQQLFLIRRKKFTFKTMCLIKNLGVDGFDSTSPNLPSKIYPKCVAARKGTCITMLIMESSWMCTRAWISLRNTCLFHTSVLRVGVYICGCVCAHTHTPVFKVEKRFNHSGYYWTETKETGNLHGIPLLWEPWISQYKLK